jgi:hypothetical protein
MKASDPLLNLFFFAFLSLSLFSSSCATSHHQPCTWGGEPARSQSLPTIGRRSCDQIQDESGQIVNEGKYYEWYLNDRIALVGEYKKGKKTGHWIEYSEQGDILRETYFEDGKEVPPPYVIRHKP